MANYGKMQLRHGANDMAITVPVPQTMLSVGTFGKPVVDEVNRLTALVDADVRRGVFMKRDSPQAIAAGALVNMVWPIEVADTDGFAAVGGTTITIPTGLDGIYAVTLLGIFDAGITSGYIRITTTGVTAEAFNLSVSSGVGVGTIVVPFAAGNTIVANVYSSNALNLVRAQLHAYRVSK